MVTEDPDVKKMFSVVCALLYACGSKTDEDMTILKEHMFHMELIQFI